MGRGEHRGRARINRDDLRTQMHGGFVDQERQIAAACDAAVSALLEHGIDVVCDDTNLELRHVLDLRRIAERAGANVEIWDMTDIDVDLCIERDAARSASAGELRIRGDGRTALGRASRTRCHPNPPATMAP